MTVRIRAAWLALCLCMLALAGCASSGHDTNQLDRNQYAYSAAIRWGDFEGAWMLVDPKYRDEHPMSDLELERYKQIQVAGYRDIAEYPTGPARHRGRLQSRPAPRPSPP